VLRTGRPDLKPARIRIAPSLLSADFSRLADELRRIEDAGAEVLHLDVMDGHYVPNISFGIPVIERLRPISTLYFDTHLMITDPGTYAEPFVRAGSDGVTFHAEVVRDANAMIDQLRRLGVGVGVSINPKTGVDVLLAFLDRVDLVNIMTVEPGFGGQRFMPEMLDKVRFLRKRLRPDQRLEVDGGVNRDTISTVVAAGADTLVAGSAVFGAADPAAAMRELTRLAEAALVENPQ